MPPDDRHIETRTHRHGPVATYQVLVEDFDRIESEAASIGSDLTFAIFWLSEAVTSTFAIPTIPATRLHVFATFEVATGIGYALGGYFLWKWFNNRNSLKKLMNKIRANQIPEFGEAGKELDMADLASLPAGQAGDNSTSECKTSGEGL
jgi:hypothetical protein